MLDVAVQLDDGWGLVPPLGKVPEDVEDVEDNVQFDDDLLDVGSWMRAFDTFWCSEVIQERWWRFLWVVADVGHMLHDVLLKVDVMFFLRMREIPLFIDVEVNNVTDALMLPLSTVLDDQGDVEVNLCDLL